MPTWKSQWASNATTAAIASGSGVETWQKKVWISRPFSRSDMCTVEKARQNDMCRILRLADHGELERSHQFRGLLRNLATSRARDRDKTRAAVFLLSETRHHYVFSQRPNGVRAGTRTACLTVLDLEVLDFEDLEGSPAFISSSAPLEVASTVSVDLHLRWISRLVETTCDETPRWVCCMKCGHGDLARAFKLSNRRRVVGYLCRVEGPRETLDLQFWTLFSLWTFATRLSPPLCHESPVSTDYGRWTRKSNPFNGIPTIQRNSNGTRRHGPRRGHVLHESLPKIH